jgi:hypothetical protein
MMDIMSTNNSQLASANTLLMSANVSQLMSTNNSQLQGFNLFPKLPYEIRIKIWRMALPARRVLELTLRNKEHPRWDVKERWHGIWLWSTNVPSPAILLVSHETRQVALEPYEPVPIWHQNQRTWSRSFVDFSQDVFFFSVESYTLLRAIIHGTVSLMHTVTIPLEKIQCLSITLTGARPSAGYESTSVARLDIDTHYPAHTIKYLTFIFQAFEGLRNLHLVLDKRNYDMIGAPLELLGCKRATETCFARRLRRTALKYIPKVIANIQRKHPHLNIPQV